MAAYGVYSDTAGQSRMSQHIAAQCCCAAGNGVRPATAALRLARHHCGGNAPTRFLIQKPPIRHELREGEAGLKPARAMKQNDELRNRRLASPSDRRLQALNS